MIDFSTEPYFDDFSEENKFYRILFRPSVAVQARELNQLQSILQNQIKKQGDHLFKNGAVVIPGEFSINPSTDYVKLVDVGTTVDITNLIGMTIKDSNGLQAIVTHAIPASGTDSVTLYVSYINAATSSTNKVFGTSATLTTVSGTSYTVTTVSAFATGFGTLAIVQKGVYYVNGFFVLCDKQTIVIDKYNISYIASTLSTIVGFNIIENEFTSDDIGYESLLDNAQGTNNYGAPGANRYFIDLVLTNVAIGSDTASFIELGRIIGNNIVYLKDVTEYNVLDKTLARRTYDQAGNYTVKGFDIDVREHRNNNRGAWNSGYTYFPGDIVTNVVSSVTYTYVALAGISAGGSAPTHTTGITNNWQQTLSPRYNRGIYPADTTTDVPSNPAYGDATKLAVGFSPGKAYVQGYEIEKISTNYINVPKPRTTAFDNNTSVSTSIGQYVQVTNVYKMPDIQACPIITLYDGIVTSNGTASGTAIGTCRVRGVQYDGTGTTQANTPARLYLFDIKMNTGKDFSRNVKSFYSATGFTANVSLTYSTILSGGITVPSAGTAVTGTGGTLFTSQLVAGDYIYYYDAAGVQQINKVASIGTNQTLTLTTTTPSSNVPGAGTAYYLVQTQIFEPNNKALVFPLPHTATTLVADHIYWVIQPVTTTGVVGNTLNISTSSGTFESDISNYFVQDNSTFLPVAITAVSATSSTAALTFAITPNTGWTVYATVRKTGTTARKTKTATTSIDTFAISTNVATKSTLTLSHTDCYKIVSIISGGADITTWYTFNTGQTDSYYDYSSLTLQPAYPAPTADVVVTYQYYAHSSGDFFDVGSYPIYDQIPFYNGKCLRDVIDFRPTIDLMSLRVPKRGYNMSVDLTYYMPRIDKIALSSTGVLFDIQGSSSMSPTSPDEPSNGMTLCSILMAPYVFSTDDVIINKVDNKRYTMRDIGSLEKRIDNLEYYTSLSLLEQETASLTITDSAGLNRFKNGFIVDNFSGHGVGDTSSADYLCAVDQGKNELRPFASMSNINLLYNSASTSCKLYGDVITLPLNATTPEVMLAQNSVASRTEFVNPFAVFAFIGDTKINPSSDDWFEVERRPDIVQNVEGNFNTIASLAEKAGVLGTVWNSWQTQWTGTPVVTGTTTDVYGVHTSTMDTYTNGVLTDTRTRTAAEAQLQQYGFGTNVGMARTEVFQTTATQVGQSRTGINTSLVAKVDTQIVDDRVLSTAVIPYIRSRNVLVQVKGLKPSTTFHPFFDNIDVSTYCTPASIITYTKVSGMFDCTTNIGEVISTDIARRITGDAQICLNIGDKITGSISGATAIVVGTDVITNPSTGIKTRKLYVVNVIGAFNGSDTITGSISGAIGISPSITTPSTLVSSESGTLDLLFNIPNTASVRFRTGSREFKLIDATTATGAFTSRGRVNYNASGVLETKQATVVATRNAELVQEAVIDNQVIIQSATRMVSDTGWWDPLAETFLINNPGGAFLSKVDIFFAQIDSNIPVTIEIREVVNGYPGKAVLPFSRVTIQPADISLSTTTVIDLDGVSYPKFDTPTSFVFPSPVYVQDQTEYALVVMSDSNKYKIWISELGDTIPGTSTTITEQPYAGVLFKSQNASTWTANQMQDMKFTVWRANFDITQTGNVIFTNDRNKRYPLQTNPFQTTSGSQYVRVYHSNHGFIAGNNVTIDSAPTTVNGATVNGTWTVQANPQLDYYVILTSGANASSSGYGGGDSCYATTNIKYETLYPNINTLSFPETTASYALNTTDWATAVTTVSPSPCVLNDNNYFTLPQVVNSSTNSLQVIGTLKSTNASLSPLIDTHRSSAIAVTNRVDSPVQNTYNFATIDQVTLLSAISCTLNGATISTAVTASQAVLKRVIPGTYVRFTGSSTNSTYNNVNLLVTTVDSTLGTLTVSGVAFTSETVALTLYYSNNFVDDITPFGSSTQSKYVSKEVNLALQSTSLRIKYAGRIPTEADVLVYYKIGTGATVFSQTNWTLLSPDAAIPKTALASEKFSDINYTISGLPLFTKVSVKIVMKSSNTAAVPRIKDLRIIACA
ncbi:Domain of unknown function DUF4815 [uncultured Caudovirales phage]|uniref:DUF4815 domain-containing protein n=1 Tax=uncultured Caudovirales phage TaxID=2100421 RepID=A0A6J5L0M5_9CAUD|nr:Domain of unknown function DUF4815 [uncultured Caudovirales phage]